MKRLLAISAVAAALAVGSGARLKADDGSIKFKIFGDTTNVVVRTVPAGPNPWVAQESRARLWPNGDLDVRIRGLLVAGGLNAAGNPVPPQFIGTNPVRMVTIAIAWAVPASVSPNAVAIQSTGLVPLDLNGDLRLRTNIGPPPPGAERPILLVRAGGGAYIGLSDFVSQLGDAQPKEDEE